MWVCRACLWNEGAAIYLTSYVLIILPCSLQAREELIDESFGGRMVLPVNWHNPRHPVVVEVGKETKKLAKWNIVQAPGYQERYGVRSLILRMKQLHPQVMVMTDNMCVSTSV